LHQCEAICEAVVRPNMRVAPKKTIEQQSELVLHRTRSSLIRQRTSVINALLGVVASKDDTRLARTVRAPIVALDQLRALKAHILEFDGKILQWHRPNEPQ